MSQPIANASTPHRQVGGVTVSALGLGTAGFSLDPAVPDERGVATVAAALDAGITLVDTARAYTAWGVTARSERLTAQALAGRDDVLVVSKGGHSREGEQEFSYDGRPATLVQHVHDAQAAIGRDVLDLFILHWPDADTPIEDSVGALEQLRQAGDLRQVGVSNVDADLLRRAMSVAPITAVQNPLGPGRDDQAEVLALCEEHDIAFLAYSPLAAIRRGPYVDTLAARAEASGRPAAHLVLGWALSLSPVVVPLVGATRPETITASAALLDEPLSDADLAWARATIG